MSLPEEIRQALIEAAKSGVTSLTYTELLGRVGLKPTGPEHMSELEILLEHLDRKELAERRPMLSALAVHDTDNVPGPRFFEIARLAGKLSQPVQDLDFYFLERDRVVEYWQTYG